MHKIGITLALSVGALAMMVAVAAAGVVQVVALDECDPASFNGAFGLGTCVKVVAGGHSVTVGEFVAALPTGGHPEWLFVSFPPPSQPVTPPGVPQVSIKKKDTLIASNQGGIVHTFTEVAEFGGGFIPALNNPPGSPPVKECAPGFSNPAVASTRVIQGSSLEVSGRELEKGTHHFECCLHPWMRIDVIVK